MTNFEKRVSGKISKLNDEQIEQLFEVLNDGKEIVEAVINSLHTGLIVCDKEFRIKIINKAVSRYIHFSIPTSKLRFSKLSVWDLIIDCDIADYIKTSAVKGKFNKTKEFTVETVDGKIRFISVRLIPFVKKQKIAGTIITVDDVTEKRNQETQLRRMEGLASLTTLAANVAHEIKNPLGAISIHIQLLQKAIQKAREAEGVLPDEKFVEKHIEIVNEEIERLNGIVVDFLFAVRPINAELSFNDANTLITQFVDFCRPELEEKNIEVQTDLMENPPEILIDPKLFKQVILNLVQNSKSAMPDGGRLWVNTLVKDGFFILNIADNGTGMDENTVSRIFEPYFTTKTTGTGLGLTMVYKIIKDFSGDIQVQSFLGEGTLFSISIPVPQREQRLLEYSKENK